MKSTKRGFTLIELMIVVAIIGILAAIAIPKFAELIRKSGEGATKGNLGAIRSALSIYYGDLEGQYPDNIASLTISGKYLQVMPLAKTPNYHVDSSGIVLYTGSLTDAGGWIYDNIVGDQDYGQMAINCSHTDSKGSNWGDY